MLALFRQLRSCSLIWCQGWLSCSLMRSGASPLAFPFATTTSFSSTIAAAFSTSASQSSSLWPCLPSNVSMSFNTDMLNWCLWLLVLCVVFIELLLLCINVLDRFRIPATNSLMSSDILCVSLRAWSSSFRRCLISSSRLAGLRLCPIYGPCRLLGATWCMCWSMLSAFGFTWCGAWPSWGQLWAPSILVLSAFGFTVVMLKSWSLSDWESCEYCTGSVWVIGISWHPFPCQDDMGCVLAGLGLWSLLTPL